MKKHFLVITAVAAAMLNFSNAATTDPADTKDGTKSNKTTSVEIAPNTSAQMIAYETTIISLSDEQMKQVEQIVEHFKPGTKHVVHAGINTDAIVRISYCENISDNGTVTKATHMSYVLNPAKPFDSVVTLSLFDDGTSRTTLIKGNTYYKDLMLNIATTGYTGTASANNK